MADEVLIHKGEGNLDVQIGGPGNPWLYLSACASMSGPTVPFGSTEVRYCQDPLRAGKFKKSSKIRTAPDQVSFDIMTKLGKVNYLNKLDCPFSTRARFTSCGERENPANYDHVMLAYCNTELQEKSYDDLVITDPGDEDEILVTTPAQADEEYRVEKMTPARVGTLAQLGDQPINDIEFCDAASCGGVCGAKTDGCSIIYGVTDADESPYAAPNLVKGIKDFTTEIITWTTTPILGLNSNVEGVECAGDRVIVSSNGDSAIAWSDTPTDQDTWNIVVLANPPTANKNALFARTARELYVASENGYVYKSVDGGQTWFAVHSADITAENINAVWAFDKDLVYAAGDNGTILKSTNGGQSWENVTETATTSADLLTVVVPPGRSEEVYVGTNDGMIYRSTNAGGKLADAGDFSAVAFTGDGVGSVDDIDFCGPCGSDVMFILHNDGGPRGRILRDLSGGNGGSDIEVISDYTQVIAAGIDLNAMACCGVNEIIAAGELSGGYPVVIKAT